jgi:collagenase-like PrtC family protease
VDLAALATYIEYSRRHGMDFLYTLNAMHFRNAEFTSDGVATLKRHLHALYDAGVRTVIVALPPLIEIVKSTGLDFRIKASVFCQVTTGNRALVFKKMGVDKIVIDEALVRDFDALKRIRRVFGEQVEVIANPYCNKECPYRTFHHNQMAFDCGATAGKASNTYYVNRCFARLFDHVSSILKVMWIRPEDVHYYEDIGINYFKLQGRHSLAMDLPGRPTARGDIPRTAECYLKQRYDGDLTDLLFVFNPAYDRLRVPLSNRKLDGFLEPFVKKEKFCRSDCETCNYCADFATRVMDLPRFEKTQRILQGFISATDDFRQLIWGQEDPPTHFPV